MKKLTTIILGAALLLGSTVSAMESNPNGYKLPDLTGYKKHPKVFWKDISKKDDGIKETRMEMWYKSKKNKVIKYFNSDNKIWAYAINKIDEPKRTIVDSDCDGDYDQLYPRVEKYSIPECFEK